jgi:hypothetical protein
MRSWVMVLVVVVLLALSSMACESSGDGFDCNYNTHKVGDVMGIAERINCLGQ